MRPCPRCRRKFVDTQDACPLDDVELGPPNDDKPPVGVGRVLGNYHLIALLGEGGMGNIYIGAHTQLNRFTAIKLLRPALQNSKAAIARFFDEARTVNRIKHPNIIESIDLVEDVVDGAYCVLELLHGLDLATRLADGPLPVPSVVRIGAQIADALGAVHALGIVHRDLKPQNLILVTRDGHDDFVKLIDFGVAQINEDSAAGIPFGTAAYMAPEQAAGERVDGRADIYALGVMLFQMATGKHPFPSASDNEYLVRHADDPPPRPSKVAPHGTRIPRDLETVILQCLAKRPSERLASASAVAAALRALADAPPKRRGWLWAAAAVVVLGAGGVAAHRLAFDDHEPRIEPVASAPPNTPPVAAPLATSKPAEPRPESQEISIRFHSTPGGARVFRAGETVPLGTTPFETTFVPSDKPSRMRFELAGHEVLETDVPLIASAAVAVDLVKLAEHVVGRQRPGPRATKNAGSGMYREGVIDPFSKN